MVKVCLGDVAREFREICKEDIAKYPHVGLEHLDSGCIALSKWDSDKETTFTKKFYKGQILFGRRRAYLKKAVVAPFDGICSGDITVFEAIPSRIYPDYLPFIIQNDSFFDYAVGKSTGSLSRRAKWEFLKKYEFDLPSLEEQKRLADILWTAENLKTKCNLGIQNTKLYKKIYLETLFEYSHNSNCLVVPLIEIRDKSDKYSYTGGPFGSDLKVNDYTESGVRIIQLQNIGEGEFFDDYKIFTSENKADSLSNCNIFSGEIIISKMADPLARACLVPGNNERFLMASDGIRLKPDSSLVLPQFLVEYINSSVFRKQAEEKGTGSTRLRIGLRELAKIPVSIPTISEQRKILLRINLLDELICQLTGEIMIISQLQSKLLNWV